MTQNNAAKHPQMGQLFLCPDAASALVRVIHSIPRYTSYIS